MSFVHQKNPEFKVLKFSGNIVINDESLNLFKDDLKELLDKYSIAPLSRSAKINVTQNLSTYKYEKYKVGSVFKLESINGSKINVCYFVFIFVSYNNYNYYFLFFYFRFFVLFLR